MKSGTTGLPELVGALDCLARILGIFLQHIICLPSGDPLSIPDEDPVSWRNALFPENVQDPDRTDRDRDDPVMIGLGVSLDHDFACTAVLELRPPDRKPPSVDILPLE